MQNKNIYNIISAILIICVIISIIQNDLINTYMDIYEVNLSVNSDGFRNMDIGFNIEKIYEKADELEIERYEFVTMLMLMNQFNLEKVNVDNISKDNIIKMRNRFLKFRYEEYTCIKNAYKKVLSNLDYFPVAESTNQKRKWITYVNSWGFERNYGGQRAHEGTDVMAGENIKGLYPIVSISDGVVTNKGWLEQGGYRLGITAENGAYFYYAHMDSYASDLEVGSAVKKGQFLGFMGNTGYSKVEGTKDKFDVHLHFGMYLNEESQEISINPYFILKYLENKILYYRY